MYGLKAVGLPDQRRLVLPDDWPDDLYPLRKDSMDYRLRPDPTTATETYEFINEKGEARIVPLGPLHITSDEPGHFRLFVDGEDIIDADYRLFYVHRGMKNWRKPVWITTKLTSWLTVCAGFVVSLIVWPTPILWKAL